MKTAATSMGPKTVGDYLAAAPKDQRAALGQYLLTFGYWKTHVAVYGSFDAYAAELKVHDQSGKGTVRFPADKPLPYGLVTKIVKTRVAEIEKAR